MGKDDVAAALEQMVNDTEVAARLSRGDFCDLADSELTEAERALVRAAAGDLPDLGTFGGCEEIRPLRIGIVEPIPVGAWFGAALEYTGTVIFLKRDKSD